MAVARNVIEFALQADASGLTGPLQKVKGQFGEVEAAAQKSAAAVGGGLDKLQSSLSSAGNKLLGVGAAMTAATLPLTLALKSGLNALVEADRKAAQTAAVLKSTGGAANVSADQIKQMSSSLRDMSGVSGGTIREGQNMLLTFTQIRNAAGANNDVFDQATKATLDMSVAMGTDMKTAALQVGKALNDPVRGLTALQRVGIQFTQTQREQIRGFVEMGDAASAQKVILAELQKEFGGSAQAFGDSAAGQAAKLDSQLTLLKMTLAQELLPAFRVVVDQVTAGVKWFNSLDDGTKKWISTVAVALVAGGPILTGLGAVTKLVSGLVGLYGRLAVAATEAATAEVAASSAASGGAGMLAGLAASPLAVGIGSAVGHKMASDAASGQFAPSSDEVFSGRASPTYRLFTGDMTTDAADQWIGKLRDAMEATQSLTQKQQMLRDAVSQLPPTFEPQNEALRTSVDEIARANGITVEWGETWKGWLPLGQTIINDMQMSADAERQMGTEAATLALSTQAAQTFVTGFGTALGQVNFQAQATGFNVNLLSQELENSFDPWLSSENAALNYQQALTGVDQAMKTKGATELQAQQSMLGLESATRQHIEGLISQGASEQQIQAAIDGSKAKIDELAAKYPGLTGVADTYKAKLQELIDKAHSVPPNKTVTVTADTSDANRKLDELKRRMSSFYGTFNLPAPVPPGARGGVIVGDTAHFASGGVFNRATAIVGEGNPAYPEFVIATDPKTKGRNRALWQAAGAHLMADGGVIGTSGGAVGGDGAAVGGDAVPVLVQIRDLLAQSLAAGPAPAAPMVDTGGGGGAAPAAPGGAPGGDATAAAATAMGTLTAAAAAYGAAAQVVTAAEQALDAQLLAAASATFPALTAATVQDDQATQLLTATVAANVPVQAQWQATLAVSQQQLAATTGQVAALTAAMAQLNATQVVLHVEHGQVEAAGASIQGLASSVSGALSSLGLSSNQLAQWLGVVLALPSGVLAGAVGAESGGVVGSVGAGMKGHTPTLVMEGSRVHDEYVIPTDPKYRSNALGLLGGLHSDLGIPALAAGGVVGKVGAAIAATTSNAMNTPWSGTGASAPGSLGSATAGSMVAAAAFNAGGGGSQKMVDYAMAQSGDQYVWGAEGPDAWDCSGLVLGSAAAAGLPGLPHFSGSLIAMASPISVGQGIGTPGALLFHPGHIAISRGDGQTIEARGQAYGVGSWPAEGRFSQAGLLPFPGASGTVGERLPSKWQQVGKFISDKFRAAGVGVGPGVAGEGGEEGGGQWSGRISTFGGPGDPGAQGGMAYDGTTMDAYYAGVPYAAMRLSAGSFQGRQGEIPLPPRSWVSISKGGASTRAQILDWGPGWRTNRLIDVAPYVADAIGAATDDTVGVTGLAKGGIIPAGSYDSGGYLPKGLSLAYNGTGQPEPVVPAARMREPSIVVNVTVGGSVMAQDDLVDTITSAIRSRTRRGYAGVS